MAFDAGAAVGRLELDLGPFNQAVGKVGQATEQLNTGVRQFEGAGTQSFHAVTSEAEGFRAKLDQIKSNVGRGSVFDDIMKLVEGRGAILGIGVAGEMLGRMAMDAGRAADEFARGKISASEMSQKILEGVPIVGNLVSGAWKLVDALDGATQAEAQRSEIIKDENKDVERQLELATQMADAHARAADKERDLQQQIALAALHGQPQAERELRSKFDTENAVAAEERRVNAAIARINETAAKDTTAADRFRTLTGLSPEEFEELKRITAPKPGAAPLTRQEYNLLQTLIPKEKWQSATGVEIPPEVEQSAKSYAAAAAARDAQRRQELKQARDDADAIEQQERSLGALNQANLQSDAGRATDRPGRRSANPQADFDRAAHPGHTITSPGAGQGGTPVSLNINVQFGDSDLALASKIAPAIGSIIRRQAERSFDSETITAALGSNG